MKYYDVLTDFIFVNHPPEAADVIFVPGGTCGEIAEGAARLYRSGYAPRILVSGKYSITDGHFAGVHSPERFRGQFFETEADFLKEVLLCSQVPEEAILLERNATYTYENAIFSRELTDRLQLPVKTAILSCQAYHARRCLLYYQLLYPDTRFLVCPTVTRNISRDNWYTKPESIDLVLGEVERCGSQFHQILKKEISNET
jgi:uncharacterized SAM-binding protein YcdF (DUF218 family)